MLMAQPSLAISLLAVIGTGFLRRVTTIQVGRIWVQPGVTKSEEIFLMNQLVTVEWNVQEIILEDRYEITLEATYQTQVPIAVLALEPKRIELPSMKAGEQFFGEMTLTNYGLTSAESMAASFPSSNEFAQFEFLVDIPDTLQAGEILTIPYRVTAIKNFDIGVYGDATGAGCGGFNETSSVTGESPCPNGSKQPVGDSNSINYSPGNNASDAPSGPGGNDEDCGDGKGGGGGGDDDFGGGGAPLGGGIGKGGGGGDGADPDPMQPCRDPDGDCGGNSGG